MIKTFCLTALTLLMFQSLNAQKPMSVQEYINTYRGLAIEEMKKAGIPPASPWPRPCWNRTTEAAGWLWKPTTTSALSAKSNGPGLPSPTMTMPRENVSANTTPPKPPTKTIRPS
jgi:hypothetical protein